MTSQIFPIKPQYLEITSIITRVISIKCQYLHNIRLLVCFLYVFKLFHFLSTHIKPLYYRVRLSLSEAQTISAPPPPKSNLVDRFFYYLFAFFFYSYFSLFLYLYFWREGVIGCYP